MSEERRAAPRFAVPEGVTAEVGGVSAKVIELSMVGAKVEHFDRFPLTAPQLSIMWNGQKATVPVRVARSEIVARRGSKLVYHSGLFILSIDSANQGLFASILREGHEPEPLPVPIPKPPVELGEDTWTRKVQFLRHELDDELPYVQFRLTPNGWQKDYVSTHVQPADGFTITRDRRDFDELQRTYEHADPETRRMMQIALESQLQAPVK
ncbi:MAG TPA: hypothetical protein VGR95_18750 [Thermoanaerobaculia bacterium]|jgi:hypothetical protein|nr:hypothetical protein [Thermoanaerobaculia bacterium]